MAIKKSLQNVMEQEIVRINNYHYFKLNYIPGLTDKIKITFIECEHHNLKFGLYNNNKLGNYLDNVKDKIDFKDKLNVVYKVNCQNFEGLYVGETSKNLKTRIDQHKINCKI